MKLSTRSSVHKIALNVYPLDLLPQKHDIMRCSVSLHKRTRKASDRPRKNYYSAKPNVSEIDKRKHVIFSSVSRGIRAPLNVKE